MGPGGATGAATASWVAVVWALALSLALAVAVGLLARQHQRQRELARTDPLTGLGNRTRLAEAGARALGQLDDLDGDGSHGPALLLLDLDGFKEVNDTLGHEAGDAVLTQVAGRLRAAVPPSSVVVRLGGDEFAVLLPGAVSRAQAEIHGKRLLAALGAGAFTAGGVELEVTASIGAAVAPAAGRSTSDLLRRADLAMYQAKRARAGVLAYTPDLAPETSDGLTTLAQLRGAVDADELSLRYQPIVSAADGSLEGFEALLRWEHPVRGLVMPAEFLPLAERTALVRPLTRWVLLTAVRQAAQWRREGLDTTIAVNVSASVLEPGLLGIVEEALARSAWPAAQLVVEITESAVASDADEALDVVRALCARGVQVSVDDFGAGYTSLGQLRSLPVALLKVDRQFVTDLVGEPQDEAIAASIIDLGHRLGLRVVAEGVEDPAVAERLRQLGCDHLQGFWVARPGTGAEALERWRRPSPLPGAVVPAAR